MFPTGVIFLLPLMLASVSLTQGHTIPHFFPPADGNNDRDPPTPSGFPDLPPPGRAERSLFEHGGNQLKSTEDWYCSKAADVEDKKQAVMELLYDLNVIACPSAIPPSSGKMVLYETCIHENDQGAIHCSSRQIYSNDLHGRPYMNGNWMGNIYTLKSEEFEEDSYHPRRLQYFNLTCPNEGYIMDCMTTDLEGQASLTVANKTHEICVDYVEIVYKTNNASCRLCGNQALKNKNCAQKIEGSILVTFRTSHKESQFKGFEMNVVCYNANEQNLPGCIQSLPAEKEKATTDNEDSHSYYIATKKFLPANAKAQLMTFYKNNVNAASTFSAESHYEMLRLALLSQNSCNAVLRALGRGVSQMFPTYMVMLAEINGWEYV